MPASGPTLPLRVLLPVLLIVLLAAQGGYLWLHARAELAASLQNNASNDLGVLLSRMQGTLDYLAGNRQYDQIYAEVSSLGTDSTIALALLLDDNNQVLASLRRADFNKPMEQVLPPAIDRETLARTLRDIRDTRQGRIWSLPSGDLVGAYPVQLGMLAGRIRPERIGLLLVVRDLTLPYQQLGRQLAVQTFALAVVLGALTLVFGILLHWIVTRRMGHLMMAAEQATEGRFVEHIAVGGNDEIAHLARALEQMFRQIERTQSELRRSEQRYAQAQRAGNVGSWELLIDDHSVRWSEICDSMFGFAPGTFPGTLESVMTRIHAEDHPRVESLLQHALETGEPFRIEFRLQLPQNGVRWILAKGEVERDADNRSVRMYGTVHDLTARKEAELALRDSEAQLQQHRIQLEDTVRTRTAHLEAALKELEAFSYSVSHDLRAPLRAIAGFSDVIEQDYGDKLDEQGRHYLERIRKGGQRMGQLIDDLLELSRVARIDITRESVDVCALIDEILSEMRRNNPELRFEFSCLSSAPADADPRLLRILLTNLLGNAIKFSRATPGAHIEYGTLERDGRVIHFVRDNGVGFDMKYVERLFTPFQRLHSSEEYDGSGIGLAIVQRIARRHGGRVWAESSPGQGATFYFDLGAAEERRTRL